MRRNVITAIVLGGLLAATAMPGAAQDYLSSVGWKAGALYSTSLNDGAVGGEGTVDIKPDVTWGIGAHYDRWLGGGQIGIGFNGALARPIVPWTQGDREIYVYMADLDLMLRPASPAPGRKVLPYLTGGAGLILWALGDGPSTTFSSAGTTYAGDEKFQLVAAAGLGFDVITPWAWGEGPIVIRLEGRDYIQFSSPFDPLNPDDGDFGMIHNAMVTLGFHTGLGTLGGR